MARSVSVSRGRRRQHLGAYMSGASDLNVETQSFEIQMVAGYSMSLYGALPLYVVGSFQVKSGDPYWHGQDFGLGNLLDETRQVPGSLTTQSLDVCLVALLVGPPLALLLVAGIAARLLPASAQSALDVLTRNPMQALWDVRWYALAAVLAALLTMIVSLWRAARLDIVSVRREATRPTRRPLWQRLRLDLWGLLIALGGFFFSLYLANTTQLLNSQAEVLLSSPLALLAPVFLLLSAALFLLRFFPALLLCLNVD
jgi:hypothetical protein